MIGEVGKNMIRMWKVMKSLIRFGKVGTYKKKNEKRVWKIEMFCITSKYWGDSSVTARNTVGSDEPPFRRSNPNRQKEVEWYSCSWWSQRENARGKNLETGNNFGTTSWPCRLRNWWSSSWDIYVSEAATRVSEKARRPILILIGWIISTKEATKIDFNIARTPTTSSCIFALFKGIQEDCWLRFELMNHVAIPLRWKEFRYHRGSSLNANSILQAGLIAGGRK